MIEESIPAFETFCKYHDVATLAADQDHITQYENVVAAYASYAALKTPVQPKGGLNMSVAIRWRTAGLQALKSIASSEAVGADGGKQLGIIMPVILQNLHSGDENHLLVLQQHAQTAESAAQEQARRRRMSIATVQTSEVTSRPTTATVTGTTDDADRLAEQEVGILAIQTLKQIYTANNRGQIRLATAAMLKFICAKVPHIRPATSKSTKPGTGGSAGDGTWATALIETVAWWAPVQDRFAILMTIMETLVRSSTAEEHLEQQLLLVSLAGWLLRSSINMIGLSVMDVLVGFIQHTLLLLQLAGKGTSVLPYHQQTGAIDIFKGTEVLIDEPRTTGWEKNGDVPEESVPSSNRQELLMKLQKCIGDLAVHIYYSDQISDIIIAILLRLKPSSASNVASTAAAIEDPQATAQAISSSAQLQENPNTDAFFSFGTARVAALKAIKEVLIVANSRASMSGAAAGGRNRVSVQVWEGTQWLLRDEDRRVRRAYVDAVLTWLQLELSSDDQRVWEDQRKMPRSNSKLDMSSSKRESASKKAAINVTARDSSKSSQSAFLQLLHLAIYDNAIESPESEEDLLLLHLLLNRLVEKLGVNAVKTGLPMILRLQEDINASDAISTPLAKVRIGSLCHGYFWTLSEKFSFDTSTAGYVIQGEIARRKNHAIWMETVQVPPLSIDKIMSATARPLPEKSLFVDFQQESVKPFDARSDMVEKIAESYANFVVSPPSSPPVSPGRVFNIPVLSIAAVSGSSSGNELPPKIKETMLAEWSKEACIASAEKAVSRTISLNGSKRGINMSQRTANGSGAKADSPNGGGGSPIIPKALVGSEAQIPSNALNFAFQTQNRHSSVNDTGSDTPMSSSEQNNTLRVDDLKRVLAGGTVTNPRNASPLRHSTMRHDFVASTTNNHERLRSRRRSASSGSESIVSAEGFESASEGDLSQPVPPAPSDPSTEEQVKQPAESAPVVGFSKSNPSSTGHSRNTSSTRPRSRPHSGYSEPATPRSLRRPSTSSSAANEDPEVNAAALRGELPRMSSEVPDEVPPVPPLPAGVAPAPRPLSGGNSITGTPLQLPNLEKLDKEFRRSSEDGIIAAKASMERERKRHSGSSARKRAVDVRALLGSIDAVAGDKTTKGGIGRPPY